MFNNYMELMKQLEKADKVHVLNKKSMQASRVVKHSSITSYLRIGVGYNYFCDHTIDYCKTIS